MVATFRTTLFAFTALFSLAACGGSESSETENSADITDVSLEPLSKATTTEVVQLERPDVAAPESTPTELIITDIFEGTGRAVAEGDTVWVDYTGIRSEDGLEFDNSYQRGEPIAFTVGIGSVIEGWDTGLIGAKAGGQRRLDIPADMAYGDNPPGGVIEAGDALTFMLEIRAVVATSTADDIPDINTADYPPTEELVLVDLSQGEGATIKAGDSAIVHLLIGNADSGEILFETWSEGQPTLIEVVEGYSIPGLYEGLQGMTVGGIRAMSVPSDLAFGEEGIPDLDLAGGTPVLLVVELVGTY
jgi:peptidylprolyl isomerase